MLEPLLGNPQATYDPRRLNWIGGRTRDNFLCLVWHTVPVQTLKDVINNGPISVEFRDVMTNVFFARVTEHFQFRSIGPEDDAVRAHPVHADGSVFN